MADVSVGAGLRQPLVMQGAAAGTGVVGLPVLRSRLPDRKRQLSRIWTLCVLPKAER